MNTRAKIKQLNKKIEEQKKTINHLRAVMIKVSAICKQIRKVMER